LSTCTHSENTASFDSRSLLLRIASAANNPLQRMIDSKLRSCSEMLARNASRSSCKSCVRVWSSVRDALLAASRTTTSQRRTQAKKVRCATKKALEPLATSAVLVAFRRWRRSHSRTASCWSCAAAVAQALPNEASRVRAQALKAMAMQRSSPHRCSASKTAAASSRHNLCKLSTSTPPLALRAWALRCTLWISASHSATMA